MKSISVVCVALIDADDRILIAKRPEGKAMAGLWEFPGGKIESGETPEESLVRELKEELGIETKGSCLAPFTFASHSYDDFNLIMLLYVCRKWQGYPQGAEGQELKWIPANRLSQYDMPEANASLIAMLRDLV